MDANHLWISHQSLGFLEQLTRCVERRQRRVLLLVLLDEVHVLALHLRSLSGLLALGHLALERVDLGLRNGLGFGLELRKHAFGRAFLHHFARELLRRHAELLELGQRVRRVLEPLGLLLERFRPLDIRCALRLELRRARVRSLELELRAPLRSLGARQVIEVRVLCLLRFRGLLFGSRRLRLGGLAIYPRRGRRGSGCWHRRRCGRRLGGLDVGRKLRDVDVIGHANPSGSCRHGRHLG